LAGSNNYRSVQFINMQKRTAKILAAGNSRGDNIYAFAVAPDSRTIAVARSAGVEIWEVASRSRRYLLESPRALQKLTYSPNGKMLAFSSTGSKQHVYVWNIAGGKVKRLQGHQATVNCLAFAPDALNLGIGTAAGAIHVWRVPPEVLPRPMNASARATINLESAWAVLASDDAGSAARVMQNLPANPTTTGLLRTRLQQVSLPAPGRIPQLIHDLDSDLYPVRKMATEELLLLGDVAEAALGQALAKQPSLEVHHRISGLLTQVEKGTPAPERLRALRAIELLESFETREARQALEQVMSRQPDSWLAAEARAALSRLKHRMR
jgi:hypothetical protein